MTDSHQQPLMLGRYALYEKIASGGMASVHIGRLVGPVGFARTVAIKRMHAQYAGDPEFVSMFLDEAKLAARIHHPNVVPTLDVVAVAGELFLVMEFVQGESLSRLIRAACQRGERIPIEVTVGIVVGVLQGLHAAHEARDEQGDLLGVVHRDVSPHNVLVGTDGVARLLDFGVAKAAGRLQSTREGQLKGKLAYMAPEQIRGTVTRATDVYAASVVLWEALTGKRLFEGDNEGQLFDRVLGGRSDPPSGVAPGVPAAVDAVTLRGLALDPGQRFPTARAMARALEDAVAPATPSRIGEWIELIAKATLEERNARVAAIESGASARLQRSGAERAADPGVPQEIGSSSVSRTSALRDEETGDALPGAPSDDMVLTQLSSGSTLPPALSPALRGLRPRGWLVPAGAALLVLAGLGVVAQRRLVPPPSAVTPASPTQAASESVRAMAGSLPSRGQASPPAVASGSGWTEPASIVAASASAATPGPPVRPASSTRPGPSPDCHPPWYFDHRGVRIFKQECL